MGSDYPFPLGDLELGAHMLDMGLEDTELENLFCNAAMQWLDLDRASFE
jgi:aminocarboxymuconate-semialdehyde decarboxylase